MQIHTAFHLPCAVALSLNAALDALVLESFISPSSILAVGEVVDIEVDINPMFLVSCAVVAAR